jgi:hypothetical protein
VVVRSRTSSLAPERPAERDALLLPARSSHDARVAAKGVMQAPGSVALDDCFDRPAVAKLTMPMATGAQLRDDATLAGDASSGLVR